MESRDKISNMNLCIVEQRSFNAFDAKLYRVNKEK